MIYHGKYANDLWLSDFTQIYTYGENKYYMSPIMDDYSRYILSWRLSQTQKSEDVIKLLDSTLVYQREYLPKRDKITLLVDNAKCYHTELLAEFCKDRNIKKKHSIRYLPATRAKIESIFNILKTAMRSIELRGLADVEEFLIEFVVYYNNQRPHKGIDDLTPASRYYGIEESVLQKLEEIKAGTDALRQQENMRLRNS